MYEPSPEAHLLPAAIPPEPAESPHLLLRGLRLALRLFRGSAAAWIPPGPDFAPVMVGHLQPAALRVIAGGVAHSRLGLTIPDLTRVPALAPLATPYRFLAAVPASSGGILVVVGDTVRDFEADDDAALSDLAEVIAASQVAKPAGGDGYPSVPLANLIVSTPAGDSPGVPELERMFTAAPDAIMFADRDRILRKINPAACRLLGYREEELIGLPTADLYVDPADHEEQGRLRYNEHAPELLEPYRVQWRRRDGTPFIAEVIGAPIRLTDGTVAGYVGIARDVTAHVRAEEALRRKTDQLRTIVQNLPVVLYCVAPDGTIVTSEGLGLERLGLMPGQAVGTSVFELYAGNDEIATGIEDALAGEAVSFRTRVGDVILENRAVPVRDEAGQVVEVIGIAMDVTDQADTEAALRLASRAAETARRQAEENGARAEEARADAERAARAQSRFLAAMSHEIRTPLTGIIGFADLLAEVAEGDATEYAQLIHRSGHRLLATLNSVLSLARLEAEQVRLQFVEHDVAAEVAEAARLLEPLAEARELRFTIKTAPVRCLTDANLLHRIVTNLVGNAIKFTDRGAVSVVVRADADSALVQITDTGRGMDPEFLPYIFEPFRREDDDPSQPSGTGLGLTITKRLVDLLGGTISVDSRPGEGSEFSLRLPLAPAGQELPVWQSFDDLAAAIVEQMD